MAVYYLSILAEAWRRMSAFATATGLVVAFVLAVLSILSGYILRRVRHREWWSMKRIPQLLIRASSPIIALIVGVFLYQLFNTPAVQWQNDQRTITTLKEQNRNLAEQAAGDEERVHLLVPQLPMPDLRPQQKLDLKAALDNLPPQSVNVTYLDLPDSRTNTFMQSLIDIFTESQLARVYISPQMGSQTVQKPYGAGSWFSYFK